jgi:multisubunit Na+/H+ antiporter MnhB subunit
MQRYFVARYEKEIAATVEIGMRKIVELGFGILALIAYEVDYRFQEKNKQQNNYDKYVTTHQTVNTLKLYYFVGVIINATGYISSTFGRAGLYWYWFEPVLMGMMVKSKVNQRLFKFAIFIFYAYLCYASWTRNGYNQIPYQFFWQTAN